MTKRIITINFVAVILFSLTQITLAQEVNIVTPSEKMITANYIKPYTAKKKMTFIRDGQVMPPRIMNDQVVLSEVNGKKQILRIQTIEGINFIDSSLNDYKSLKPIFHRGHNVGGDLILNFGNDKATGKKYFSKSDSLFIIDTKMESPYFDSNIYELVLSALPLAKGLKAKIPTYIFEENGLTWFEIEVTGDEEITLPDGSKVESWKVNSFHKGTTTNFWFSKKDHEFLKLSYGMGNNMKIEIVKM